MIFFFILVCFIVVMYMCLNEWKVLSLLVVMCFVLKLENVWLVVLFLILIIKLLFFLFLMWVSSFLFMVLGKGIVCVVVLVLFFLMFIVMILLLIIMCFFFKLYSLLMW